MSTTAAERPIAALAATSRIEGVMRHVALVTERARDLELRGDAIFAQIIEAQHAAEELGVRVDILLTPGMAAAFSAWKQARNREEGRAIAHEEMAGDWHVIDTADDPDPEAA